jgi:allantoicase
LKENSKTWNKLIEGKKLKINQMHVFNGSDILHNDVFTHIRVDIYPDGGIARLKLIGKFT